MSLKWMFWVVLASLLGTTSAEARELLVGDGNRILRVDLTTGAQTGVIAGPEMAQVEGMAFGPDGQLYVSDYATSKILKYDGATFAFLGVFRSGPELHAPVGLTFGPDGRLYVATQGAYGVVSYDLTTAQPVEMLVVPQVDGSFSGLDLFGVDLPDWAFPAGIALGSDGTIYLAGGQQFFDHLLRKRPLGAFETFVAPGGCGDGSFDVVVAPDGSLFFSDEAEGCVMHADPVTGGTGQVISGSNNAGLAIDLDNSLYNYDTGAILRTDPTGAPLSPFQTTSTQMHAFITLTPAVRKPAAMPIAWPAPIAFPGRIPRPPGRP